MKKIILIIIFLSTYIYATECSCNDPYRQIGTSQNESEYTVSGSNGGTLKSCLALSQTLDDRGNSVIMLRDRTDIASELRINNRYSTHHEIVDVIKKCFKCMEEDEKNPPPDPTIYESLGYGFNSCQADANEIAIAQNGCSEDGGNMYALEKIDCCTINTCFREMNATEDNTTEPTDNNETNQTQHCQDDFDCDGIPDNEDDDMDGDGIPNGEDTTPLGGSCVPTYSQIKDYEGACVECAVGTQPDNPQTTCISSDLFCVRDAVFCDNSCECPTDTYHGVTPYQTDDGIIHFGQCKDSDNLNYKGRYCETIAPTNNNNDSNSSEPTCNYPIEIFSLPFLSIVLISQCNEPEKAFPCTDKTVACYGLDINTSDVNDENNPTDNESDSNSTSTLDSNNTTDNNQTITDSNGTVIDTSKIESKLDKLNKSLSTTGAINKSLISIGALINKSSSTNHKDLISLGSKLDGIKSAIESQGNGSSTDMTETNQKLDDIKDALNPNIEYDNSELDSAFSNAKTVFTNALSSFETSYNDIVSMFNSGHSSTVTASGDCTLSGSTKNIGSFGFDFSVLSQLRAPFQFFLNLMLLFFTIKLYTTIARDLVRYIAGA